MARGPPLRSERQMTDALPRAERLGWLHRNSLSSHHQRAAHCRSVGGCEPQVGRATCAPRALHRTEDRRLGIAQDPLLVRRELDHRPLLVGMAHGREYLARHTEIWMAAMRSLGSALERKGKL